MAINAGDQIKASDFTGMIVLWSLSTIPSRWLVCDGAVFDMDTYPDLADLIKNTFGQDTGATFTADAPTNVITSNSHGLSNGNRIVVTNSGGGLPGGLSVNTIYFIISSTTNTFKVSLTSGGSEVDITSAGTGTHSWHNQVKVPDMKGRVPVQRDSGQTEFDVLAETGGAKTHTLTTTEIPSHTHDITAATPGSGAAGSQATLGNSGTINTDATGGGGAHNNLQPYIVMNYIIHV